MQETQVRSLVWEDSTCHHAAKPACHNYWACALEPENCNYWIIVPQLLKSVYPRVHALQQEKTLQCEAQGLQLQSRPRSLQLGKSQHSNEHPAQPKIKINKWNYLLKKWILLEDENRLCRKKIIYGIFVDNILCGGEGWQRMEQASVESSSMYLKQWKSLEKEMGIHSSILAWRIPWTEEPGGLQSMECRVRHDWVTNTLEVKTAQGEFSGDFHKTFSYSPSTVFQWLFCSQTIPKYGEKNPA